MKFKKSIFIGILLTIGVIFYCSHIFSSDIVPTVQAKYYIDFDQGSDSNNGTSYLTPWKHCPGDPNVTFIPANTNLIPGYIILFKAETVYKGQIKITKSGDSEHQIEYLGEGWGEGKAIIDGSEKLSNWTHCTSQTECKNNPNWMNIYYTKIDNNTTAFKLNLHEYNESTGQDEFLAIAQTPNQPDSFFMDSFDTFFPLPKENITLTSITDANIFNQTDSNYWSGSSLLIWVNPNTVVNREITSFNPTTHTVYFDTLASNAIYGDRDQYYSIYNSIHALDNLGEYYLDNIVDANNKVTLYLIPKNPCGINENITYSVRNFGFDFSGCNFVTVSGFNVRKHVGEGARQGVAIGSISVSTIEKQGLIIKNNLITHNRYSGVGSNINGHGGIYLNHVSNSIIENNTIAENSKHRGILIDHSQDIIVKNNIISRPGGTSFALYSSSRFQIIGNTISECKGTHSNGITIYMGCTDILVANNIIYKSNSPITIQDSGNLFFYNNIIDGNNGDNNFNEWANTSGGINATHGVVTLLNNIFVNNQRNASINLRTDTGNTYIVKNNFIDGGAASNTIDRSHNIYTGLMWNQAERYGWQLGLGEMVQENLNLLFVDPVNLNFHHTINSIAINNGIDIAPYIVYIQTIFPNYNFNLDIEGNLKPIGTGWDIGPYEYVQ